MQSLSPHIRLTESISLGGESWQMVIYQAYLEHYTPCFIFSYTLHHSPPHLKLFRYLGLLFSLQKSSSCQPQDFCFRCTFSLECPSYFHSCLSSSFRDLTLLSGSYSDLLTNLATIPVLKHFLCHNCAIFSFQHLPPSELFLSIHELICLSQQKVKSTKAGTLPVFFTATSP